MEQFLHLIDNSLNILTKQGWLFYKPKTKEFFILKFDSYKLISYIQEEILQTSDKIIIESPFNLMLLLNHFSKTGTKAEIEIKNVVSDSYSIITLNWGVILEEIPSELKRVLSFSELIHFLSDSGLVFIKDNNGVRIFFDLNHDSLLVPKYPFQFEIFISEEMKIALRPIGIYSYSYFIENLFHNSNSWKTIKGLFSNEYILRDFYYSLKYFIKEYNFLYESFDIGKESWGNLFDLLEKKYEFFVQCDYKVKIFDKIPKRYKKIVKSLSGINLSNNFHIILISKCKNGTFLTFYDFNFNKIDIEVPRKKFLFRLLINLG